MSQTLPRTQGARQDAVAETDSRARRKMRAARNFVAGLSLCVLVAGPLAASDEPVEVNRVLLRINDRIATLHDFQQRVEARASAIRRNPELTDDQKAAALEEVQLAVLRAIWEELLIASRADQLGVVVSQQQVEEAMLEQMRRFQIENVDQLRMALAQEGLTLERFRDSLAMNLLFREVMGRELFPRVRISEDELRSLYRQRTSDFAVPEQVQVRELVVLEGAELGEVQPMELAEELARRWRAGEEPAELAEEKGEAVRLLDIGWVAPGDLAGALEQEVWPLEAGTITGPVEARGGLHVLQVVERKAETVRPFEEVREVLAGEERSRKMQTEQEKYLQELESRAYYEADPPPGLADFRTVTGRSLDEGGLRILDDLARPDLASDPAAAAPVEPGNEDRKTDPEAPEGDPQEEPAKEPEPGEGS